MMDDMAKRTARHLVALNLKRLMSQDPLLRTQKAVAEKAQIAQTAVGYMLNPDTVAMASPKLDTVEKVAKVFKLEVWQLLIDPETFGQELANTIQRPAVANSKLEAWRPSSPTDKQPQAVRGNRGRKKSTA